MINRLWCSKYYLFFAMIFFLACHQCNAQVIPLPNAYAHNDYKHQHPLYDALNNGFTHLEADIYLRKGQLVVAHILPFFKRKHTLEKLYLEPFFNRLLSRVNQPQTAMDSVVLMIDIKSNAEKTYAVLLDVLSKYSSILSGYENGKITTRNITVVLTGHKPLDIIKSETSRIVFVDENLRKVDSDSVPGMYSTASCSYSSIIKWKGKGIIPGDQKERLSELVAKAHATGTKVRLWASPENKAVWKELLACGVDLINTDKLKTLKEFFISVH